MFPLDKQLVDQTCIDFGLRNAHELGSASIRQLVGVVKDIERATGEEFIHMELGEPGLPAEQVGIEAEHQALLNGYGKHDPASVCVGEPEISAAVNGGEAVIENPASRRVVIRVSYRSAVPGLAQTNIEALVNEKSAFTLLVGNTNGGTEHDYREISLPAGENKFVFVSQNPLAEVSGVDIFPVG